MKQKINTLENQEIGKIEVKSADLLLATSPDFNYFNDIPEETLLKWSEEEESKRLYRLAVKEGRVKDF